MHDDRIGHRCLLRNEPNLRFPAIWNLLERDQAVALFQTIEFWSAIVHDPAINDPLILNLRKRFFQQPSKRVRLRLAQSLFLRHYWCLSVLQGRLMIVSAGYASVTTSRDSISTDSRKAIRFGSSGSGLPFDFDQYGRMRVAENLARKVDEGVLLQIGRFDWCGCEDLETRFPERRSPGLSEACRTGVLSEALVASGQPRCFSISGRYFELGTKNLSPLGWCELKASFDVQHGGLSALG